MLRTARKAGNPEGQMANFIAAGYAPQPKQLSFHAACRACDLPEGPTEVGFGGARGPGKSHAMLEQMVTDDMVRHPGLKCLLLRRVGKAVRESFQDLRSRVLWAIPHKYNRGSGVLTLPNGSRLILGHFHNEGDIDSYLGLEYGLIGVEEATTLSSQKYRAIRTCNRTSDEDWRPRIYSNANPGGVGHSWYKERFVIPYQNGAEGETRFVPATFRDNRFLNVGYERTLNGLVGWQKRAWRDGDWDVAVGQFFTNFNRLVHVVKAGPVPEWEEVWLSLDYGFVHPTFVLLFARGLQGNIRVVDEYGASRRTPETHSILIREMLGRWGIREARVEQFSFGRDSYQRDKEGRTVVDSYEDCGWHPDPANMARAQGAAEVLRRLGDVGAGIAPTLTIHENCRTLIETIPRLEHNPNRPEDTLKVNIDEDGIGGDDAYDALRYGLMSVSEPTQLDYDPIEVPAW